MDLKQQIQNVPRALRETLEKGKPEYLELIRRTRLGEGPIYICASGSAGFIGLAGAYAFEMLLNRPVVLRTPAAFQAYTIAALQPRSVVLLVSPAAENPEDVELAQQARKRGATVLVFANPSSSLLAQAADGTIAVRADAEEGPVTTTTCQHAALNYLALLASVTLRKPHPQLNAWMEEFERLPQQVDGALTHLTGGLRSLATEIAKFQEVWVIADGFYHPVAIRAAGRLRELSGLRASAVGASEIPSETWEIGGKSAAALFLSGSRCKLKDEIHKAVAQARIKGVKAFSITDSNDREVSERSELSLLTPTLSEISGAQVALALVEWLAIEAKRAARQGRPHSGS